MSDKQKKELKPAFKDHRNTELFEKINEVIYGYAVDEKMTRDAIVGVLERVKMDLWYDDNITD